MERLVAVHASMAYPVIAFSSEGMLLIGVGLPDSWGGFHAGADVARMAGCFAGTPPPPDCRIMPLAQACALARAGKDARFLCWGQAQQARIRQLADATAADMQRLHVDAPALASQEFAVQGLALPHPDALDAPLRVAAWEASLAMRLHHVACMDDWREAIGIRRELETMAGSGEAFDASPARLACLLAGDNADLQDATLMAPIDGTMRDLPGYAAQWAARQYGAGSEPARMIGDWAARCAAWAANPMEGMPKTVMPLWDGKGRRTDASVRFSAGGLHGGIPGTWRGEAWHVDFSGYYPHLLMRMQLPAAEACARLVAEKDRAEREGMPARRQAYKIAANAVCGAMDMPKGGLGLPVAARSLRMAGQWAMYLLCAQACACGALPVNVNTDGAYIAGPRQAADAASGWARRLGLPIDVERVRIVARNANEHVDARDGMIVHASGANVAGPGTGPSPTARLPLEARRQASIIVSGNRLPGHEDDEPWQRVMACVRIASPSPSGRSWPAWKDADGAWHASAGAIRLLPAKPGTPGLATPATVRVRDVPAHTCKQREADGWKACQDDPDAARLLAMLGVDETARHARHEEAYMAPLEGWPDGLGALIVDGPLRDEAALASRLLACVDMDALARMAREAAAMWEPESRQAWDGVPMLD